MVLEGIDNVKSVSGWTALPYFLSLKCCELKLEVDLGAAG